MDLMGRINVIIIVNVIVHVHCIIGIIHLSIPFWNFF